MVTLRNRSKIHLPQRYSGDDVVVNPAGINSLTRSIHHARELERSNTPEAAPNNNHVSDLKAKHTSQATLEDYSDNNSSMASGTRSQARLRVLEDIEEQEEERIDSVWRVGQTKFPPAAFPTKDAITHGANDTSNLGPQASPDGGEFSRETLIPSHDADGALKIRVLHPCPRWVLTTGGQHFETLSHGVQ